MAAIKTIQFLPDVFRTDTNRKFLNATLDQLISEPNLTKINGYIGRKLSPSYKNTDYYIAEVNSDRQNYQLEPSVVIKNPITNKLEFATTYTDIINKIGYYGGFADNHNRLFDNENYTFDPKIDLDKFVNFSQYYWLENGPAAVTISAQGIPLNKTFNVIYDSINHAYNFSGFEGTKNPTITLARGGTYNFVINDPGNNFFIQSKPGTSGTNNSIPNLSVRNVLGVENNGADVGTVTYKVPSLTSQLEWTSMPRVGSVEFATNLSYRQIQGANPDELNAEFGGIDGFSAALDAKRLIFVNNEVVGDEFWGDAPVRVTNGIAYFKNFDMTNYDEETTPFDPEDLIPFGQRNDIYQIAIIPDEFGIDRIVLTPVISVANESKIIVTSGTNNVGREFYSRLGVFNEVPQLTATLNVLFYQNAADKDAVGGIQIIEIIASTLDPAKDIIGKPTYTSPNGVVFTNGLKVTFDTTATDEFANKTYYVEGVGTAIKLVLVSDLIVPELNYNLDSQDYLTIKRGSIDKNAWSRSNRWFHSDVIQKTADYNGAIATFDQTLRASRPIIEFDDDLQLYNSGVEAKTPIDNLDNVITSAFTQVQGKTVYVTDLQAILVSGSTTINLSAGTTKGLAVGMVLNPVTGPGTLGTNTKIASINSSTQFTVTVAHTGSGAASFTAANGDSTDEYATFTIGTESVVFTSGSRIVFSNDVNNLVRNKIYNFTIELVTELPDLPVYKAYLEEADDSLVENNHTVLVKTGANGPKQWYYNGTIWKQSQLKTKVNQHPLFDIINDDGLSFADTLIYPGSSFSGTKIFSYKESNSTTLDPVLGIGLSYRNFLSQGDILFQNDFDSDEFSYLVSGGGTEYVKINFGFLQKNITRTTCQRQNIWVINQDLSKQYQIYSFVYDGETNLFSIDNLPEISFETPNIKVLINSTYISADDFAVTQVVDRLAVLVNPDLIKANDVIFVQIFNSILVAPNAYYEVPQNFDINTLNTNLSDLTLGQMRNHLITLKNNNLNVIGDVPGKSNIRDIQYRNKGGSILQHSAPMVYAGLFLNHPTMNFVNSIELANREYTKFKTKFLDLAVNLELDRTNISGSVDAIMAQINAVKNDSFPWYYSDMVPHGSNSRNLIPTYTILDPDIKSYEITSIYNDKVTSNKAVLVYLTRTINQITTKSLLLKERDFYFNQERPAITFQQDFNLLYGDLIDIVEYNDTDGSYVPETPTKLGLYPKFVPEKYLDTTYRTPVNVIQGHDGSLTPAYNDYRDDLLIELERRIYNNIKVEYDTTIFNMHDYLPSKFRLTDYSLQDFNQLLSRGFLSWVGNNRIDYTTNKYFKASDEFTWNYVKFRDVVNGESLPGTWRAVYRYFYDTDRPHTHPWEMLGFSEKPSYWDERYGPAPYTGGNAILWSDLSTGYIHAGPRQGFDIRFQRPNLALFIPVDDSGNLRPPSEMLVTNFDSSKANVSYAVGHIGPAELAWRRSSEFPFAMQLALALAKPARYFALLCNTTIYNRNLVTAQFNLQSTKQHITPTSIDIHGYNDTDQGIIRGAGYVNWIRDYIKNLGITDAANIIKDNLTNLNVQLSYKLAGYTDKKLVELLAEQNSPSSVNDSIVIPDENYRIELYKGAPISRISYSAVIIEKSVNGYTVSGYDLRKPYFYIIPSQPNNNSFVIRVGSSNAVVYKDYKKTKLTIPYGFEFNTKQQVVDFLVGYQRYLQSQGFIFDKFNNELNEIQNWILSVKEYLNWSNQGWKPGSIIVLSPVNDEIKIYDDSAVVDEVINAPDRSRILDINLNTIIKNNFTVSRENNIFTIKSISSQTIGYAEFDLVQYEHLLILDNVTVFQDVIYVPELGNRQYRLKLIGAKTSGWTGSLELPGYIYSSEDVEQWVAGKDYQKGTIVEHKFKYYTALQDIVAADQFQTAFWKTIASTELRSGMINNFATNATQAINFYDIDNQPFNESLQLFSNGLIGFRSREYFSNLGINALTQSKFYQGFIRQKGTNNALIALKGANFANLETEVEVYENWAVRVGEYGATDVNQSIEIILDETKFKSNPAPLQFVDNTVVEQEDIPVFELADIFKRSDNFNAKVFSAESLDEPGVVRPLPTAGPVNLDDIDTTIFNIKDYRSLTSIVNEIGTGYKIWTAKDFNNEWNVYRATHISTIVFSLAFVIDELAEIICRDPHGLAVGDIIVIKNFDISYDGVYQVHTIIDSTRFYVTMYQNLESLIEAQRILNVGILFKLTSMKVQNPHQVDSIRPPLGWIPNDKIWVADFDGNQNWGVYNKIDGWAFQEKIKLNESQYSGNDHFGKSISLSSDGTIIYSGAPESGGTGRVSIYERNILDEYAPKSFLFGKSNNLIGFGEVIANGKNYLAVGAPNSDSEKGYVYVYKNFELIQILTESTPVQGNKFGASLAMSNDGKYLYVGAPGNDVVYCYAIDTARPLNSSTVVADGIVNTFTLPDTVNNANEVVATAPLSSSEFIPNIEYSITQVSNGIITLSGSGTATSTNATYLGVSCTGGTGTGAIFNITTFNGSYTGTDARIILVNSGSSYTAGDTLTISGTALGGASPANDLTITVLTVGARTNAQFISTPSLGEQISLTLRQNYYSVISTLPVATEVTSGSNFGVSLVCNDNGSTIVVGADNVTRDGIAGSGAVFVYHRTITDFITDGVSGTYLAADTFNSIYRVTFNDEELIEGTDYYIVNNNSIQFEEFSTPEPAQKLRAETNNFVLDQTLYSAADVISNEKFGSKLAMCTTGCNIYISSPRYKESHYSTGLVTRFVNNGRVYGDVTGTVSNPTVTAGHKIIINNFPVTFFGSSVTEAAQAINTTNIPGVDATVVNNKLRIQSNINLVGEKLYLQKYGTDSALSDLGLLPYSFTQILKHPEEKGEVFGTALAVDQTNGILLISSEGADLSIPVPIDPSLNTKFDSGSTNFVDFIKDTGGVYVHDLMTNPFENENSPSLYVYTQKLSSNNIDTGFDFGKSLGITRDYIFVGVINDYEIIDGGGSIYQFYNQGNKSGWELIRYKEERTDFETIRSIFAYNRQTKNIVQFFDLFDPAKGKLLGLVDQELDYKEEFDPAAYNVNNNAENITNTNFYWTNKQVGRTWWDLSTAKFIDYEQDVLQYRIKNWGSLFPGSVISIYEWVESNFLPSQYVASGSDGVPKYTDNSSYSSVTYVDPATGVITQKYYYWVRGRTSVDFLVAKRTLSTSTLENYILSPKDQGVPYIAPLARNALSIYNVSNLLTGTDIVLHIDTSTQRNPNLIHNEYQLIQQGNPLEIIPLRVIDKLRDSLVGFNSAGQLVPDPTIGIENQTGILLRPRQSFFINRLPAVETFVRSVNKVFAINPVLLISNASKLFAQEEIPTNITIDAEVGSAAEISYLDTTSFQDGYRILIPSDADYNGKWTMYVFNGITREFELKRIQSFKTSLFWELTDWYSESYVEGQDIKHVVDRYADIQKLTLSADDLIRINDNGNGQFLIYRVLDDNTLDLIAAESATLQLKQEIYDTTLNAGFDAVVFDLTEFDPQAGIEISNIFDSVYSEIFIKDLAIEFNNIFFAIVNYIYSEQKNPDWIFKTSFIDVLHKLRTLTQLPSYTKDNQSFYEDYINEAKPYRTKIRDYIPKYSAVEQVTGDWTDFDLVSKYDFGTNTFRSPDDRVETDAIVLANDTTYSSYYQNYKLKISGFTIANAGIGYTIPPSVEITGGGGTGAKANAEIWTANSTIKSITITNPGEGYITTPNININGLGVGGRVYPIMHNEFLSDTPENSYNTIRNIKSTIKFDRTDYFSANLVSYDNLSLGMTLAPTVIQTGSDSTSNIWISSGNIYVYANEAYILTATANVEPLFDFTKYSKLNSANVLLRAVERIGAYYVGGTGMPDKDIPQLVFGTEYPGIKVTGPRFETNSFSFTSNIIGFNYTGLRITSANIQQVDFQKLGFNLNDPIKIEALVPFDFKNNGVFKTIEVNRDSMLLTGAPIETVYNMTVGQNITANVGDYITQANTLANAWVVANVYNSRTVPIIHSVTGFTFTPNNISVNGIITNANVQELTVGGTVSNVKISNLYIDDLIDSNIYSVFTDANLGTRPEDINIIGGAYLDSYVSHAPEEFVPGRMFDALEIRTFSNNTGNTATYGFRIFTSLNGNVDFTRISNVATTSLAANLNYNDTEIQLTDASILPDAGPLVGRPGVVFVNGEKIHYYQKYDTTKLATAVNWTANTFFHTDELITGFDGNIYLVVGNVYANSNVYINANSIQKVTLNTLAQIRRGVDGTGIANIHLANTKVVDSSLVQEISNIKLTSQTITGNVIATANVTWKLTLSSNISANVGDYLTQFVGNTGNVRVLGNITNANVVAVDIITGNLLLAANTGTRVNIANLVSYSTTTANVLAMQPLGQVYANGNVVLNSTTCVRNYPIIGLGVGTGLENSATTQAEFIIDQPSYIP